MAAIGFSGAASDICNLDELVRETQRLGANGQDLLTRLLQLLAPVLGHHLVARFSIPQIVERALRLFDRGRRLAYQLALDRGVDLVDAFSHRAREIALLELAIDALED